jgi:hypothetical protein
MSPNRAVLALSDHIGQVAAGVYRGIDPARKSLPVKLFEVASEFPLPVSRAFANSSRPGGSFPAFPSVLTRSR